MSSLIGWTVGQRERLRNCHKYVGRQRMGKLELMAGRRKEEPVISGG